MTATPAVQSTTTTAEHVDSLRERVAAFGWRRRIAARRTFDAPYRLAVGIVGGAIVAAGIATIPLPGPGWLIIFAGLFLLATEFLWAERLLAFSRHQVSRWTGWLTRQALWVRTMLGLFSVAFGYGIFVVTLHLAGVPGWIPEWLPLWR